MPSDIDFVLPWVNGNDEAWQADSQKYASDDQHGSSVCRFRDWGLLPYWFRGVEKYAPWVRKVHFVTCGHCPKWLNLEHPKLNFVKHSDYMPQEYLPTFNSNSIEINFHRIKNLAEKFVLFNDDFFIIKSICQEDFFKGELPADQALMKSLLPDGTFGKIVFNNMEVISKYFKKREVLKKHFSKWFNIRYGFNNLRNFLPLAERDFSGMHNPHLPIAYNKTNFLEVWNLEQDVLDRTSKRKFRDKEDVSHWLFRYFRIMKGEFKPSPIIGKHYELSSNNIAILLGINKQKHKIISINDSDESLNFTEIKAELINAFEKILPNKSEFEV
jgi:hypothetical protein